MSYYQEFLNKKKKEKELTLSPEAEFKKSTSEIVPNLKITEKEKTATDNQAVFTRFPPSTANKMSRQEQKKEISDQLLDEEKERQKFLKRVSGDEIHFTASENKPVPEEKISISLPPKPSKGSKFVVRTIFILIFILLIAAISLWWYNRIQNNNLIFQEKPEEIITKPETKTDEIPILPLIAPAPLLAYHTTRELIITQENELSSQLLNSLKVAQTEESLVRLIFQDQKDKDNPKFITMIDFLNNFEITMPTLLEEIIKPESFNLFIHFGDRTSNLGLITQIEGPSNLADLLKMGESNLSQTIIPLLSFLGRESLPAEKAFTAIDYNEKIIRCQKDKNQTTICYVIIPKNNLQTFILTTSSESLKLAIDSLL